MWESNLIAPIFKWAYWWLSDDIFIWIDNSFFSSKNIDIRSNARWISLAKALVLDSATTITEKINIILKLSTWWYMAFWASWWLYLKATTTWAKITSDSPATAIVWACEFNWYLYWATVDNLHRILVTNISTNITATDVINRQALTSASYHPMLVSWWDLYIGNGNKVGKIDTTNVYEDKLTLWTNDVIKDINDLWWSIRLIKINSSKYNSVDLRDWVDSAVWQTIPLIWFDIRHSQIFNWYNYLITNRWLGILDWYKIYPIKKINQFNDNMGSITVHDEKLYIWWTWWVYVFWNKNKNYPEVLNLELSTSNWSTADEIWAIYSDWTDLYVSWSNATSFWIDKLSTTTYYTTWELVTKWYYCKSLKDIKELLTLMIWYKKPLTNQKYTISYSVDWWSYTKLIDITPTTNTKHDFTEDITVQWYFQYVQFKFELEWPWTTTPEFYVADLLFNDGIKR